MILSENLKKNNITIDSKATTRWKLIEEMVNLAVKNQLIDPDHSKEIKKALIDREKSMSTGIGNGVAIPHCTTTRIDDIILLLTVLPKGMDFNSIDNQPVKIVILLLVPKNKLTQHIKTLANIAKMMSNENLRNKLLTLKTTDGILKAIKNFEKSNENA
jgi:fructose-specific phosphotransferase system IIA component